MKKVAITGYGLTKFTKQDIPIQSLMLSTVKSLFENTPNLAQKDIDVVLAATNDNTKYLSSIVAELCGISPKVSHSVESLCNSGTTGAVSAFSYIASGLSDVALVVGAEKIDSPGQVLEWDISRGEYKHPIYWASLFTKAHTRKYNTTKEDLAFVSAKNHRNAVENPHALFEKTYSFDDVMASRKLTDDLRVLDCSLPCSGSAAILMVSDNYARKFTDSPVWITGIGQKTTSAGFTKNRDLTSIPSTAEAARDAFKMAKKNPKDVDAAELHDAFTILEIMELEDIGFVKKGDAKKYVKTLYETQDRKINPRGGILGSGHPLGATGIAQIVEITQQLQRVAGKRQVDQANVGLVQNMSAAGTSSTVLILES